MSHIFEVGQIIAPKVLPENNLSLYIHEKMYQHAENGWKLQIKELSWDSGRPSYRCNLLNADGEYYERFTYLEEWIQSPYKSFDELNTALSKGEINDEQFLEVLKNGIQV